MKLVMVDVTPCKILKMAKLELNSLKKEKRWNAKEVTESDVVTNAAVKPKMTVVTKVANPCRRLCFRFGFMAASIVWRDIEGEFLRRQNRATARLTYSA